LTAPPSAAGFVELVAFDAAPMYEAAWRDLSARAAEPNVFAEPEFVVPALACFGRAQRLQVMLVWSDAGRRKLNGVLVLRLPAFGLGAARIWQSNQAGLPAMLLDRQAIAPALGAALEWLARERPRIVGLFAPTLEAGGATALALSALAARQNFATRVLRLRQRAALAAAKSPAAGIDATLGKKRAKEWARQRRRLAEGGAVTFSMTSDANAIEDFLALEAKGWKGARGTALKANPALATFTRTMLRGFAAERRLTIGRLERGGAAIAIGLVLQAGGRAFYWKTAYDEEFATYSPGLQLTLDTKTLYS
jgi:CelD/BcsL family acetyltransferase involved in cellulose biosynthesis